MINSGHLGPHAPRRLHKASVQPRRHHPPIDFFRVLATPNLAPFKACAHPKGPAPAPRLASSLKIHWHSKWCPFSSTIRPRRPSSVCCKAPSTCSQRRFRASGRVRPSSAGRGVLVPRRSKRRNELQLGGWAAWNACSTRQPTRQL